MTPRRQIIVALGLAPLAWAGGTRAADSALDDRLQDFAGPLPAYRLSGSHPASRLELAKARDLLLASPRTLGDARAVARYFETLMDLNAHGERYNAAWAQRWNPLIVGLHRTTSLRNKYPLDKGDAVPWNAAFVNWCLAMSGCRTTRRSSSGAFRTHGQQAHSPQTGDIVVFKHAHPERARAGHGHVGFYAGPEGDKIRVLGANHATGQLHSAINESTFPVSSDKLVLHSFRSVPSLRTTGR